MFGFEESKALAYQFINKKYDLGTEDEILILEDKTRETSNTWIFHYNSRKYLESGNALFMMQVDYPIVVSKTAGTCELKMQGSIRSRF